MYLTSSPLIVKLMTLFSVMPHVKYWISSIMMQEQFRSLVLLFVYRTRLINNRDTIVLERYSANQILNLENSNLYIKVNILYYFYYNSMCRYMLIFILYNIAH